MRLKKLAVLGALAALVAACKTTTPTDYVLFHAGQDPTTIAQHLAERVGACWFDGKHKAFADYSYAPEPGVSSTRILIVPKATPQERPALVIDVKGAKHGTDVKLFGPLMQTDQANSLRTDVKRWTGGARDC